LVPLELVKNYIVIPIEIQKQRLTLVMANPLNFYAVDDIRFATQLEINVTIAPEQEIIAAIEKYYPITNLLKKSVGFSGTDENVALIIHSESEKTEEDQDEINELLDLSKRTPIVNFTNAIIDDAIKLNASDIHIEPQHNAVVVRYRIDGVMREIMKTERNLHAGIITRIKAISKMDISSRRKPQDGKLRISRKNTVFDLRISTLPTSYGEKVTIRLLNPLATPDSIDELNFSVQSLKDIKYAITQPQGIVLVTGPTGSGKTRTLYTFLKTLMSPDVNIVTLENPIENDIDGINQVEINPQAGLTFASGLRSILRQDPDIILLGEIRDVETASIAFQAAQTGHLVLSTIHTGNAPSAVARLMDLGVDPYNISASLNAVVAQQLVRRICVKCKVPDPVSNEILQGLPSAISNRESIKFWKGKGCVACNYTGYSGRIGLHEVLRITANIQNLIRHKATAQEIEKEAYASGGYQPISVDGIRKAADGLTSLSEIYRVAPPAIQDLIEGVQVSIQAIEETEAEDLPLDDSPLPVASVAPRKILVAEDNEFMLRLIQGILDGEGYVTITAQDGAEALKIALTEIPDLIVTDYLMPKLNGIELIRKLRSKMSTSFIPVIILTIKDEIDLEVEGINAGADDFIVKPINARKLIARVSRLLKKRFDQ
jgi:type IV pilus assembly protein PilB